MQRNLKKKQNKSFKKAYLTTEVSAPSIQRKTDVAEFCIEKSLILNLLL